MYSRCRFFLFFFLLCKSLFAQTNCIQINELLINGPGACDGGCNPNTEEWVELYNNCNNPVDISCWVMADGDFTVTIPSGTILSPGGYYLIGSNNSSVTPDLNIASCNCTSGTPSVIGTFTNGNEQLLLTDDAGNIADAIQWGAGQFPVNISPPAILPCNPFNLSFNSSSTVFEILPQGGANGCTMARICDGAPVWEERCTSDITGGTSNGQNPLPAFSASAQVICASSCISFSDQSSGQGVNSWQWFFSGASTGGSVLQNPAGLCYNQPGAYEVTLSISSVCGNFSLSIDSFITVTPRDSASILPDSSATLCQGDSLMLIAGGDGPFQWMLNGNILPGLTNDTVFAGTPGNYAVISGSAACADTSALLNLNPAQPAQLTIAAPGSSILCQGDSVLLVANSGASLYSFILNNFIISTQTDSFLYVSQPGTYAVIASGLSCTDTSNQILILFSADSASVISAAGDSSFCEGASLLLLANGVGSSIQWLIDNSPLPGANDPTLLVNSAGSYALISDPAGACPDTSASFNVQVLSASQPSISSLPSGSICQGDTALLFHQQIADSLSWILNGLPLNFYADTLEASISGSYELWVQYANGCSRISDPFMLTVNSVSTAQIISNPTSACEGEQAILSVDLAGLSDVLWSNGSTGTVTIIAESGSYSFSGITNEGCLTGAAIEYNFVAKPFVDAGADQVNLCGSGVTLIGLVTGAEFEWLLTDEVLSSAELVVQTNPSENTYYTLLSRNGNCISTDSVLVEVSECELFIPDAFSPNGDGKNDIFRVRGPALSVLHLEIYDRWGTLVHALYSPNDSWSGEIMGKPAESGVYHWVLFNARDLRGQQVQVRGGYKGNVTLLR